MSKILDQSQGIYKNSSAQEIQTIIREVYRQVLGNPHVMESERLIKAESQFYMGELTIREFIRQVAKSDFYRRRYFESCAPYRFVELNFKHLLGRGPQDQVELSKHIVITINEGFDAEIDSYLDSDEYQNKFGDNIVPYYQGITSIDGKGQSQYNRTMNIYSGYASVDSAFKDSRLADTIITKIC